MSVLLDTNMLTRAAHPGHPLHQDALAALDALRQRGEELCIVPQNLYEFWVVATRPVTANGMGMSPAQAEAELSSLKTLFRFLNDSPRIYTEWERVVTQYAVSGKPAHDARLVAAMLVHGLMQLLTFNVDDFVRFSTITVLSPRGLLHPQRTTSATNDS